MASIETNTRKIVARLEHDGWIREHGGMHDKYTHATMPGLIVVPRHKQQSRGVARAIAKMAGWG